VVNVVILNVIALSCNVSKVVVVKVNKFSLTLWYNMVSSSDLYHKLILYEVIRLVAVVLVVQVMCLISIAMVML
jgi:hypothetical protein